MTTLTTQPRHRYTLYCFGDRKYNNILASNYDEAMSQLKEWAADSLWGVPKGHKIEYGLYRGYNSGFDREIHNLVDTYVLVTNGENTY